MVAMQPHKSFANITDCKDLVQCAFSLNEFEIEIYKSAAAHGPIRADEAVCAGAVSISKTSGTGSAAAIYNAVLVKGDGLVLIQAPDADGALIQALGTYSDSAQPETSSSPAPSEYVESTLENFHIALATDELLNKYNSFHEYNNDEDGTRFIIWTDTEIAKYSCELNISMGIFNSPTVTNGSII